MWRITLKSAYGSNDLPRPEATFMRLLLGRWFPRLFPRFGFDTASTMNAMMRICPARKGHASGKTSKIPAINMAHR